MKKSFKPPGFPTGVENIGGGGGRGESSKFDEWGLSQYMGKGGGLKMLSKVDSKVANYKPASLKI